MFDLTREAEIKLACVRVVKQLSACPVEARSKQEVFVHEYLLCVPFLEYSLTLLGGAFGDLDLTVALLQLLHALASRRTAYEQRDVFLAAVGRGHAPTLLQCEASDLERVRHWACKYIIPNT